MKRVIVVSVDTEEYAEFHKGLAKLLNKYSANWNMSPNLHDLELKTLFNMGLLHREFNPQSCE